MNRADDGRARSNRAVVCGLAGGAAGDATRALLLRSLLCCAVLVVLLSGIARAAVIYSQPTTDAVLRQSSQLGYDRFSSDYDMYVWDDFTLPATQSITEVTWRGVYTSGGYWGGPVIDFVIGIYPSIPGGFQPDVINPPLVAYTVGSNAGENPVQPSGQVTQSFHDYDFVLPTPFVATAGVKYWIQIEAIQAGPTDWGLTAATSGTGGIFFAQAGVGDFQYFAGPGNVGFTLLGPDGPGSTPTATSTATATMPMPTATDTPTATATPPPPTPLLLSGDKLLVKDRAGDPSKRRLLFVSKDTNIAAGSGAIDPTTTGAVVQLYNPISGESVCLPLPAAGWQRGGSASSAAYTYRDNAYAYGPCKLATVKDHTVLKVVCLAKGQPIAYSLNEPTQGALAVRFSSDGTTICTEFGGTMVKDSGTDPPVTGGRGLFKAMHAAVPASCPAPPTSCP